MKIVMGVCLLAALAGCTSSKEAYKQGCKAGIYTALESFGVPAEQVDPARVADACDKLESAKKSQ